MWHSVCDGMSTCCNNGGSCCAGVFPRMPCHPVCHPCGPCNPCGPCSPSPCRPCNPCNPCVPCVPCMPCDGAGARGRCISLVAPGVPTSGLYKKKKGKKKRKGKKKKKGKKGDSKLGAGDGDGRRRRRGECVEECPGPGGKRGSKARGSELRSRDSDASYRDGDGRGRDGDGRGRDGDGRGRDGDGRGRDGDGRGGDGRGRDGDGRGRDGDGRGRDGDGRGRDGDGRGRSGRGSGFGRDGRGRDGRGGDGYGDGYGDGRGRDGRGRDGRGKDGRDVYSREGQGRDGRNGNGRFGSRTSFGRGGGGGGNGKDGGGMGGGGGGPGGRDGKCVCPSRVFRRPTSPPCVCEAGGDGHREAAGGGPCARGRTASSAGGPGRGRPRARGRSHSEDPRRSSCTLCPFARKQVSKAVSAIVALSLLAANHASGACTCPESGPAGLAPGAAPCPGAASAPACPAMAPGCPPAAHGCPPAAPGCPAAGPAVHVPCAPPGFSDESACPADQAQAPAGCLRPTLSEMPKLGAMDCPMIANAPLALEKHGVQFLGTGQPTFCHTGGYSPPNPPIKHGPCLGEHGSAQQAENGPPQQQGNVCLLGLRPEMYPELPSIYSQWLGCGPYFPNPVPGMPGLPACIPGMGSPRGILPPCVAQEPEPSQSPPQSPPSSPAPAASPPSSPGCTASPDRNKRAEMSDQAASAATMTGGGNGNGSNVADADGPQAAGTAAPVADCGCGRRRGPCPPHCLQPKPRGDDGEARRHERMRRRLESRVPKCTLPLVLPYQRRRASSKSVAKPLPEPPKAPDSPKPKTEPCVEEKAPEPKPPDSPERTETPDEWGIPSLTPFHVPPRRTRSVSTPPGFRPEAPTNGPVVCPLMGPTCPMITGPTGAMMPLAATGPVPASAVGVAMPVRPIMAAGPPGPAGPALQAAPGAAPGQVAAAPAPRPKGAPSYGTGPCEDRPRRGQSETRRQGRSRRRRNYTNFDPVTGKCLPCPVQPAGCARTGQPEPGMGPLLGPCDPPPERALKCGRVPTLDGRAAPCTMTLQPDEKPPCLQSKTLICKRTPITNTLICYERGPPLPCVADPNLCGKPGTCVEMPCMQPVPRPPPPPPPFTRKQLWPPCPNARSAPQPASICDAPPRRSKSRRPKDGPKAKADDCPTFTRCVTGHP